MRMLRVFRSSRGSSPVRTGCLPPSQSLADKPVREQSWTGTSFFIHFSYDFITCLYISKC
jgi:hypothetical protein